MEDQAGKYLTFELGKEEYGIPILKVKEIIGMMDITEVPRTPEFVKGVINLRGKIIPVIDLRLKFGLDEIGYTERTCIIVVEVKVEDRTRMMGIVVDTVSEVVKIQQGEIEPPPSYGTNHLDTAFLTGMGKVKGKVIMLLDIERILTSEEMTVVQKIG